MSDELDCPADDPECFVETMPLAEIIDDHVKRWRRRHPKKDPKSANGFFSSDGVKPMGAHEWLTMKTGFSEATIRRAQNPTLYPQTRLEVADALVAAIGSPQAFSDGTLEVSCCGGSTAAPPTPS